MRTTIGADSKFSTQGSGSECQITNADYAYHPPITDGLQEEATDFSFVEAVQGVTEGEVVQTIRTQSLIQAPVALTYTNLNPFEATVTHDSYETLPTPNITITSPEACIQPLKLRKHVLFGADGRTAIVLDPTNSTADREFIEIGV